MTNLYQPNLDRSFELSEPVRPFKNRMHSVSTVLAVNMMFLFSACATPAKKVDVGASIVPETIYPKKQKKTEGSIWQGDAEDNELFSDAKAHHLGDIVTITVSETATSSQSATTATARAGSVNLDAGRLLGLPGNLGIQNFLGTGNGFDPRISAETSSTHDGSGTTTRNGTLTATISAKIVEILPNNVFKIEGTRAIVVNHEEQLMSLTGLVRYQDIGFDNTISSTLIADASITYSGQGVVADNQRVGWGTRLISWIWPF